MYIKIFILRILNKTSLTRHLSTKENTRKLLTDTFKSKKETSWVGWSVCHSFPVAWWLILSLYRVNFTFGLLKCDRYIGDIVIPWIVKSGFCSIHFTILAGLKNFKRYIKNIVILEIVISIGVPLYIVHCMRHKKVLSILYILGFKCFMCLK